MNCLVSYLLHLHGVSASKDTQMTDHHVGVHEGLYVLFLAKVAWVDLIVLHRVNACSKADVFTKCGIVQLWRS